MSVGRPSKYTPEHCESIIRYFSKDYSHDEASTDETISIDEKKKAKKSKKTTTKRVGSQLPTFEGWCFDERITTTTMLTWTTKHEDFLAAYTQCKHKQKDMLIQNTLNGRYNSPFAIFLAKNITDLRDDPVDEPEDVELIV